MYFIFFCMLNVTESLQLVATAEEQIPAQEEPIHRRHVIISNNEY